MPLTVKETGRPSQFLRQLAVQPLPSPFCKEKPVWNHCRGKQDMDVWLEWGIGTHAHIWRLELPLESLGSWRCSCKHSIFLLQCRASGHWVSDVHQALSWAPGDIGMTDVVLALKDLIANEGVLVSSYERCHRYPECQGLESWTKPAPSTEFCSQESIHSCTNSFHKSVVSA